MKNWQNQCYITAPLFILIHEDKIREYILKRPKDEVIRTLCKVMIGENKDQNWLHTLASSINPEYSDEAIQFDANEFLQRILDKIDPVSNFFNISSKTIRKCQNLGCQNVYNERIGQGNIILLRLKENEDHISMAELIDRYMTGVEQMPCNNCSAKIDGSLQNVLMKKTVEFQETPEILFVCADRYHTQGYKINTKLTYTQTLWLPLGKDDGRADMYRLFGLVQHHGERPTSGHYDTYISSNDVKCPMQYNDNGGCEPTWNPVSWEKYQEAKHNGYIFCYKKHEPQEGFIMPDWVDELSNTNKNENEEEKSLREKQKSRIVQKLVSTPEIKSKKMKEEHCHFCVRDTGKSRNSLMRHLETDGNCKTLYLRNYHQTNLLDVSVVIFDCIACDLSKKDNQKIFPLKIHLKNNGNCLSVYCKLLNVTNLEEVMYIVKKQKRKNQDSRSSSKRRLESVKNFNRNEKSLTITTAMNDFKRDTVLGNHLRCALCKGNYLESAVKIVKKSEAQSIGFTLEDSDRRMSKHWVCHDCNRTGVKDRLAKSYIKNITLEYIDDGNVRTFVPVYHSEDPYSSDQDEFINRSNEGKIIRILLPNKYDCVAFIGGNPNCPNFQNDANLTHRLSQCKQSLTVDDIRRLFTNQFKKYQSCILYSQRFFGKISDMDTRQLSEIEPLVHDKHIHGSMQWEKNLHNNMHHRFDQLGIKAVNVTIQIGLKNIENLATIKLIQGQTVTYDFEGNSSNEQKIKYWLHDHSAETDCSQSCVKTDLKMLDNSEVESNDQYSSVIVTSVFLKQRSLIENLVKNQTFELGSSNYIFDTSYDLNGTPFISGLIWPSKMDGINTALHEKSYDESINIEKDILAYQKLVEQNFCTSSCEATLMNQFEMTYNEAKEVSKLVKKHQIDFNKFPSLPPSLETFYKLPPSEEIYEENIQQAEELTTHMIELLMSLPNDLKKDLSTRQWLEDVDRRKVKVFWDTPSGLYVNVTIQIGSKNFHFSNDKMLTKLILQYSKAEFSCPFMGYYQYSLRISRKLQNEVVMKKEKVIESFTYMFNPIILKAVETRIHTYPVHGPVSLDRFENVESENFGNMDIDQQLLKSHKVVSLNQLLHFNDNKKCKILANPPVQYINCSPFSRELFMKVFEETETTFSVDGEPGFFEKLYNDVLRHKLRLNGDDLLLCETATLYEFVGNEESEKLSEEIKRLDIDEIRTSNSMTSSISGEFLPEYIVCSNDHVMKLRKNQGCYNTFLCFWLVYH